MPVADAVDQGARLVTGGKRIGNIGNFFEPTVLAEVPLSARIMNEEPFGPVAVVNPFTSLDQAITEAKDGAAAAKEAAKNAANETLAAAKTALDAANTAMADLGKCRRQPKDFKKDMELMKGNYDGLAAQVGGIESAIASEDYLGAKAQGDSLKSSVDMLVSDLQGAKVKIKC